MFTYLSDCRGTDCCLSWCIFKPVLALRSSAFYDFDWTAFVNTIPDTWSQHRNNTDTVFRSVPIIWKKHSSFSQIKTQPIRCTSLLWYVSPKISPHPGHTTSSCDCLALTCWRASTPIIHALRIAPPFFCTAGLTVAQAFLRPYFGVWFRFADKFPRRLRHRMSISKRWPTFSPLFGE